MEWEVLNSPNQVLMFHLMFKKEEYDHHLFIYWKIDLHLSDSDTIFG